MPRVWIAAGGTGGHLFPALAAAREIARQGTLEVRFFCRDEASERERIEREGFPAVGLPIRGLRRKPGLHWVSTMTRAWKSMGLAARAMNEFEADLVVGFGSYVSFPAIRHARRRGIPYALHEQNAWPGMVNRHYGAGAVEVWCADMQAAAAMGWAHAVHTGYPLYRDVRPELRDEPAPWPLDPALPTLLVYGGSQGSLCLNRLMADVLPGLRERAGFNAIIQTGALTYEQMRPRLEGERTVVLPFIEEMDAALAHADVIVARAGAGSLAEITAWGRPAFLVPLAIASGDHQAKNAATLTSVGAAVMRREHELPADATEWLLRMLTDEDARTATTEASRALGRLHRDAAGMVARRVHNLLERNREHGSSHRGNMGGH